MVPRKKKFFTHNGLVTNTLSKFVFYIKARYLNKLNKKSHVIECTLQINTRPLRHGKTAIANWKTGVLFLLHKNLEYKTIFVKFPA